MIPSTDLPIDGALAFCVLATFLLAGFVKGVIGLGLPTIAVGLLSMVMLPAQAAAILIVPSFVTNVWQVKGAGLAVILRRLWTMMLGICVGTLATAGLLSGEANQSAVVALGVALVAYALVGLTGLRIRVPASHEVWLSPLVGVTTGAITGVTGVFVIPAVPYLQALGFDKDELIQALGVSFLVSTIAMAFSLASGGTFGISTLGLSSLALLPALAGMVIGQVARSRVGATTFKRCFFVGLLGLGMHLAVRNGL
ncbi:MAG TPA: sulfite exporter TauE/SafE family protein [Microvirga sp.]|jgi:uncharacterized membrane protein YfcA